MTQVTNRRRFCTRGGKRKVASGRYRAEALEQRRLLAAVSWDGGGDGTNWTDPVNWSGNTLPQAADDVTISVGANPTILIASGTQSIHSLVSNELIRTTGGTLAVSTTATASQSVTLASGGLSGGAWTFSGGAGVVGTSSGGTLANVAITGGDLLLNTASALVLLSGTTSFPAARLQNTCTLQMAPGYTLNNLVVAEGATAGQRTISMAVGGSGTVTYGASAVVRLATGCGGNLSLQNSSTATLINNGLISAEAAGRTLTIQNSTFTNSGTTQLTAGTLALSAPNWSNPGAITAASGTTANFTDTWSNAGTLSINGATLNLGGNFSTSGFNFPGFSRTGGTVNLTGTLNNAASTLTMNAATGTWNLSNGTINGGTVNQTGGSILAVTSNGGTLANVAMTGADLLFNTTSASVLLSGTTSFPVARLQNTCTLQMAPGYTLNSLVVAEGATAGQRTISMAVGGSGTVTIAPGTEVRLAAGCGGNLTLGNSSTATLINNGLITAEATGRTLAIQNTTFTNNTTTQVTAGTLNISPTNWSNAVGASITAASGTTLSITGAGSNAGSITAASGTTVTVGGGGTWSNAGTLSVTSVTLNLGGTFSTAGFNFPGFTRTGGTVNLTGTLDNAASALTLNAATGTWNLSNGTISGGTVNQTGGSILALTSNGGTLANVAITGGDLLLNSASASVLLSGTTSFSAARLQNTSTLQMAPGYTLNNLVVAEGATAGQRTISMAVGGSGTATIAPAAIVRLATGCGGNLTLGNSSTATLINNGLISAEAAGRTLSIQNSTFTNSGTTQVTAGTLAVSAPNWSNPGAITAASGTTLNLTDNWSNAGTLSINGATLNLGGTFSTAGFNFPGFSRTGGTVNLTGTLNNAASTLTLNAATGTWNFSNGTINGGTVNQTAGSILALTVGGGTLANVAMTGADLLFNASSASVLVSGTTTFPAARLQNACTLQLAPGYTLNNLVVAEGATAGQRSVTMAVGGLGTVTIAPGTEVRLAAGCGGNLSLQNSSTATLINNGLITAEATARALTVQNTTFTNNATTQVTAGTLNISPTNWSNPGTITAGIGTTLSLSGAWSNAGNLSVNSASLTLGGTFATSGFNFAGFTRTGGTVNLTGTVDNAGSTLTLNAATGTWIFAGATINNGSVNQTAGSLLAMDSLGGTLNNVAVSGDLLFDTTSASLTLIGSTSFPAARLRANAATLRLTPGYTLNSLVVAEGAATGQRIISLAVGGAGTNTFAAGATVRLAAGCGGNLAIQNSSSATLVNNGTISAEAAGRTLSIQNSALTHTGTLSASAGTMAISPGFVNAGSVSVGSGATMTIGGALINPSGSSVSTAGRLLISGLLDIQSGSTAIAQPGGTALIRSNQITIASDNRLSLNDNDMIIDYNLGPSPMGSWNGTAYNGLTGLIQQAYNFGAWDGVVGITTSTADAQSGLTTLAIAEAADALGLSGNEVGVFDGQNVDATTVLIKYTYAGDANLDGGIDGGDYGIIDNFVQVPGANGYFNGDFNYDGVIDGGDYGIIDNNVQAQGAPL